MPRRVGDAEELVDAVAGRSSAIVKAGHGKLAEPIRFGSPERRRPCFSIDPAAVAADIVARAERNPSTKERLRERSGLASGVAIC